MTAPHRMVRSVLNAQRLLASFVIGALVAILALVLRNHRGAFGAVTDFATVTTFLFGVLLVFAIQRTRVGSGRYMPRGTVRMVDYPSLHPEMSDKVVVVETRCE